MNNYDGKYIVDKIRNLSDNSIHERENSRKGQEVYICNIEIDKKMYIDYDEFNTLKTSKIKEVKDYDDYLQVYTMNTLYQFKKVNK